MIWAALALPLLIWLVREFYRAAQRLDRFEQRALEAWREAELEHDDERPPAEVVELDSRRRAS
jgi:hypothetical protein